MRNQNRYQVTKIPGGGFELVPPPEVLERNDDIEEVYGMIDAGEDDVAVDELRWLLSECKELLEAHKLLGDIAFRHDDIELARSHYTTAFELGDRAIGNQPGRMVPSGHLANRLYFEAGKQLVDCLVRLDEIPAARKIAGRLTTLDLADPLGIASLLPSDQS